MRRNQHRSLLDIGRSIVERILHSSTGPQMIPESLRAAPKRFVKVNGLMRRIGGSVTSFREAVRRNLAKTPIVASSFSCASSFVNPSVLLRIRGSSDCVRGGWRRARRLPWISAVMCLMCSNILSKKEKRYQSRVRNKQGSSKLKPRRCVSRVVVD